MADAKKPVNGPEQLLIIISYYLAVNTRASALAGFSTEMLLLSSIGLKVLLPPSPPCTKFNPTRKWL